MTITRDLILRPMQHVGWPFVYEFAPIAGAIVFVNAKSIHDAANRIHVAFNRIGRLVFLRRWTMMDFHDWWNRRPPSKPQDIDGFWVGKFVVSVPWGEKA